LVNNKDSNGGRSVAGLGRDRIKKNITKKAVGDWGEENVLPK